MQNTKLCIGTIVFSLLVNGCTNYDGSVQVADIRKEETIILKNTRKPGYVYSIHISGSGNVDGDASVSLILNGEPYKTEKLKGTANFQWSGDWYSDTAEIRYQPGNVNSGNLVINYSFFTS